MAAAGRTEVGDYRPNFPLPASIHPHFQFLQSQFTDPPGALLYLTAPGLLDHANGLMIKGWLWPADALKLYEMAYFASGDILELGTAYGLSTCIMAQAIVDSGRSAKLLTVDICEHGWKQNVDRCDLSSVVEFRLSDATRYLLELSEERRQFTFSFVDHSHTYEDVAKACLLLPGLLTPGSFLQFHDYSDPRNGSDPDYGVWQAVQNTLPPACHFSGIYGCSGLYRNLPG